MNNNVGLTVIEGVGNGATAFKGASKRNIGLLMQSVRGIPNVARKIISMEEYNTYFGAQSNLYYGPAIVKNIFDEAQSAPVTLYPARVVGADAKAAAAEIELGDASHKMSVTAGQRGAEDPGIWGNNIVATLYSYGYKVNNNFRLEVRYNGTLVEQFTGETLANIQYQVNKVAKYITVDFTAELEKLTFADCEGTLTAETTTNSVTGTGTKFTELKVGNVLYTKKTGDTEPAIIGTVASIESDTSLTLVSRSMVALTSAAFTKRNDKEYTATLSGGIEGTIKESDFYPVESATDPKGLACFSGVDVQIIACTEFHSLSMAKVMNDYVQTQKSFLGVINLPLNADEGTAELYAMELQTNASSFLAGYLGWVKVNDSKGNAMIIPALGAILGAGYIRTPYLNGDFVHIPPAGTDSVFSTVLDVIPPAISQPLINKLVTEFSCNVLRYMDGKGYYVGTSRTYSTNDMYSSIHIRLQTSYYVKTFDINMKYLEQKPNTPELKREATVDLTTFFQTEYDNGALERSIDFSQACEIICDLSNNPRTQSRKELNIDVYWIPSECTERILITLRRNDSILTTLSE